MKTDISVIATHYKDYANSGYLHPSEPQLLYKGTDSTHKTVDDCLRHMVTTMREFSPRNFYPDVKGWSDYRVFSHPALGWGYLYLFTGDGKCVGLHITVKASVPGRRTGAKVGNG